VALVGKRDIRVSDLADLFPVLAGHLGRAEPDGPTSGAISMSTKLRSVVSSRIALVGDASGSVDAVTGEGLALAFRQANCLSTALAAGDLQSYDTRHRRMARMPLLMARILLVLDGDDRLRRMVFRSLAAHPRIFSGLLAIHVGTLRRPALAVGVQSSPRECVEIDADEASRLPQNRSF
jgi:flavin-dependent dehydrogenase